MERQEQMKTELKLAARLMAAARMRFGSKWDRDVSREYFASAIAPSSDPGEQLLLVPWSLYHRERKGQTIARWFLEHRRSELTEKERSWLEAETRTALSIWRIDRTVPGEGLFATDAFTGEERWIEEINGSRSFQPGWHLLARILVFESRAQLIGMHPVPLGGAQRHVDGAVEIARNRGTVRFHNHADTLSLIGVWRMMLGTHHVWEQQRA